jgi:hypothetical protein
MSLFGGLGTRKELQEKMREAGRLPPGQSLTLKWPVLHTGRVPRFDAARWDFQIIGRVEKPIRLSWEEFNGLPLKEELADFHCVTHWSRSAKRASGFGVASASNSAAGTPCQRLSKRLRGRWRRWETDAAVGISTLQTLRLLAMLHEACGRAPTLPRPERSECITARKGRRCHRTSGPGCRSKPGSHTPRTQPVPVWVPSEPASGR